MSEKGLRGDRLKAIRESRGLTQQELANSVGMNVNLIYRYENGLADPSPVQLKRLAKEFGVSSDWLLGLADDTNDTIRERTLTNKERRFLEAYRHGRFRTLLEMLQQTLPDEDEQSGVSGVEVGIDSEPLDRS